MQAIKPKRYVRIVELIGNKRATPPTSGMIPLSAATIWRMVRRGDFPSPVKLGPNSTAWPLADVEEWLGRRQTAVAGRSTKGRR